MNRYRLTSPDGRTITIQAEKPPTQEDAQAVFAKVGIKSQSAEPSQFKPDTFTFGEKLLTEAIPFATGIGGGILGVPGGLAGIAAGGAVGTAGGRAIADLLAEKLGGPERSLGEIGKRAVKEGAIDVAFTYGTAGLGKYVGKPLSKVFKSKILAPALEGRAAKEAMEAVTQKTAKLKTFYDDASLKARQAVDKIMPERKIYEAAAGRLTSEIKGGETRLAELIKSAKAEAYEKAQDIASKRSLSIIDDVYKTIDEIAPLFTDSSEQAIQTLRNAYRSIKISKTVSGKVIDLSDQMKALKQLSGDKKLFTLAGNKVAVGKVAGSVKQANNLTVDEVFTLKKNFSDIRNKIFEGKSTTEKHTVGQALEDILKQIDDKLDLATNGAFSKLNSAYREAIRVDNIFAAMRGKGTGLANKASERTLKSLFDKSRKSAVNEILRDAGQDGDIFRAISTSIDNLMAGPKSLIRAGEVSGSQDLIELGTKLQDKAVGIVRSGQNLQEALDSVGKVAESFGIGKEEIAKLQQELASKVLERDDVLKQLSNLNINKEKMDNIIRKIGIKEGQITLAERKQLDALKLKLRPVEEQSLLPIYMGGIALSFIPGLPPQGKNLLRGATMALLVKKWGPQFADVVSLAGYDLLKSIPKWNITSMQKKMLQRFANRLISEATFNVSEL